MSKSRVTVQVLINETRGSRFEQYEESAEFSLGPSISLEVEPNYSEWMEREILDRVWALGNGQPAYGDDGSQWDRSSFRSLSVGDVVIVWGRGAWAVDRMGWTGISAEQIAGNTVRVAKI